MRTTRFLPIRFRFRGNDSSFPQVSSFMMDFVMTMPFSLDDQIVFLDMAEPLENGTNQSRQSSDDTAIAPHLFAEKLRIPRIDRFIHRPRLNELLDKSAVQYGATLVCGRAGTGKTALASAFAADYKDVAWYSVEAADKDWRLFSNYFIRSLELSNAVSSEIGFVPIDSTQTSISTLLVNIFIQISNRPEDNPMLVVLDDIHHIFDATWFEDFFSLLLYSLLSNTHLLLLSRSKPPLPLWRLRSKQRLNVVDEKLLAFTHDETQQLFEEYGLSHENAEKARRLSFGRISKLIQNIASHSR